MSYGIVYIATNLINKKRYVGQTIGTLENRQSAHKRSIKKLDTLFARAIRKYGFESFVFDIAYEAIDQNDLNQAENLYIIIFNTLAPNGYNLKHGGASGKYSDELKIRHSKTMINILAKPEVKAAMSRAMIARWSDPAKRKELGEKIAAAWANPEKRIAHIEALKAICHDPNVRIRKSDAMREVHRRPGHTKKALAYQHDERREAWIETIRDSHNTEKFKQKQSIALRAHYENPEVIEAVRQRSLAQFADSEKRARHKAAYDSKTSNLLREINKRLIWITDGIARKKIDRDEAIPNGWRRGMPHSADHESKRIHSRWHAVRGDPNCVHCII